MSEEVQPPDETFHGDARGTANLRAAARAARERSRGLVRGALLNHATSEILVERARDLVHRSVATQAELRRSVVEYVITLRQLGEPPESVVVLVKSMVDESAGGIEDSAHVDPLRRRALRDHLVRWAIDSYYAA